MAIVPCSTTTEQHGIVQFDPAAFKAGYPEFTAIADAVLAANFDLATLVLANSCNGLITDAAKRERLLNLLVAHVTQLRNGSTIAPASGVVGQVVGAGQGSVNMQAFQIPANMNQAWFSQTQWGLMFWTATAPYRTMQYVPAPEVCADYPMGFRW